MRRETLARPGGYTLLELLAVLAIAGILMSTAVPALGSFAADQRRSAVVNDLLATLLLARSEGAKRGRNLVVCGIADRNRDGTLDASEQLCTGHDWSEGWLLGAWDDRNGDSIVGPGELRPLRVFQTRAQGNLSVWAGNFTSAPPVYPAGTVVLKGLGHHSSNGTITVCDRRGRTQPRAVIVSAIGRARSSATRADGQPLVCP